jgi:hypothetical protein
MRNAPLASTDLADIQQSFADAYPRIQGLASARHCRLKGEEKEEAVAETIYHRRWRTGEYDQPIGHPPTSRLRIESHARNHDIDRPNR